jgi:nitrogen-specific signal transduction histidine kinase/CheY-like chemotaxis protein
MQKLHTKSLQNELKLISKKIDSTNDCTEINNIIQDFVIASLDAEFCSLWFYDKKNMTLFRQRDNGTPTTLFLEEKRGIIYKCFMTQEAKIYNYLASDKDYVSDIDNPDNIKIKSKIIFPLLDNDEFIGIVTAYNSVKKAKKFRQDDMDLLKALSPYLIDMLYKMHTCGDKNCHCHKLESSKTTSLVLNNIEKLEHSSEELISAEKLLNGMGNFIHDIRTPANTLQGFLELLENQITDKRLKEYIVNAKESANFINELTTAMLDKMSLHHAEEESNIKEIDTVQFFANIAEMFVSNMYTKKIAFNIYIDPLLPRNIEVDIFKLKRVVMNLISNAYKFTPYKKSIEFGVRYNKNSDSALVYVKDKGIGIAKDKQEQIFKAYKQADETTSLRYGGTGLGLSICADYVKDLGGELKLESELEKGSTFYFTLPLKIKDNTPSLKPLKDKNLKITVLMSSKNSFSLLNIAKYLIQMSVDKNSIEAVSSLEEIPKDTTHLIVYQNKLDKRSQAIITQFEKLLIVEEELFTLNSDEVEDNHMVMAQYGYYAEALYKFINSKKIPKVLIVDDDKTSVVLLEKILESEYCEIEVAQNGKLALEMIIDSYQHERPYSVVYIDNHMPLMSGLEVMRHVREFEKDNNLDPLYAVSTSGDLLDLNTKGKDFDCYVGKPFKVNEIREILYR